MKPIQKKYLFIAGAFWLILISGAMYVYYRPSSSTANSRTDVSIAAGALYDQYNQDEALANKKFLKKIIEVRGVVGEVEHTGAKTIIQLDAGKGTGSVYCSFVFNEPGIQFPPKGTLLTVKGKCSGYLMDVNLVDCVITKSK